jgi:ParB family chromosome partitioning protein
MIHHLQIKPVPLVQINFSDHTFRLTPFADDQPPSGLRDSIRKIGLLHPPIVMEIYTGSFQIISGRKRLQVLTAPPAAENCDCLVLARDSSELYAYRILFEEHLFARPMSSIEQAMFFAKILPFITITQAAEEFLPRLGLRPSPFHIEKLLSLLDLEEPLQNSIHRGRLHEKTGLALSRLPFKDRWALFEIIEQLQLSVSNQQKLLSICRELAIRCKTAIAELLASDAVNAILNQPQTNIPQKSGHLMTWLTERRFPRLTEAERQFHEFAADLHLPKGARLTHSPAFEKNELTLSLTFKDETEFLRIWQKLHTDLANSHQSQ